MGVDYVDGSFYEAAFGQSGDPIDLQDNGARALTAYLELAKQFAEVLNRVHYQRPYWDRGTVLAIMHSISSIVIPSVSSMARTQEGVHEVIRNLSSEIYRHLRTQSDSIDMFSELVLQGGVVYRIVEKGGAAPRVEMIGEDDEVGEYDGMKLLAFLQLKHNPKLEIRSGGSPGVSISK